MSVGQKAKDFSLLNTNLERISLSSFNGKKVVLLFFPLANTSTCEKEMCKFRDDIKKYEDFNAEVIGISVDSPFALKMWKEKLNLNFTLLSDFNKEISTDYNSIYNVFVPGKYDFVGVSKRSAFVIDENRMIQYAEVLDDSRMEPNYEKIKEILNSK